MRYELSATSRFKKDLKAVIKRGHKAALLHEVVDTLLSGATLDEKHRDHALGGTWAGYRECHITPDWLLIYKIDEGMLLLLLTRTGTHSDLL